jgi:uncharacterized membrane protein YsdA (DUF1294 family)
MAKRMRPEWAQAGLAAGLVLFVVAVLFAIARPAWTWFHLLLAWLVAVNLVTFGYYAFDKARARRGGRRVAEVVLHGLALAGGTAGAYLGMVAYRHKTIKPGFRLIFRLIAALQAGLVAALLYRVWAHPHS